jgi:hypothetical protein
LMNILFVPPSLETLLELKLSLLDMTLASVLIVSSFLGLPFD